MKGLITMMHNIVIGTPLVESWTLISSSEEEWEQFDKRDTLFTNERFLPAALVEAGIVKSNSEVKRNKPELYIALNTPDCFWVKWGKQRIWVIVGE